MSDLEGAVDRGEIVALFQPQIDVQTRQIVAVEALARWNHPELGSVPPEIFIPIAEEHHLINRIGDFMIDEGCRLAADFLALGHRIDVAVNVSAAQLLDLEFLDRVQQNIQRHALSPANITVEVTESLPIADVPEVSERLVELRELGLGISVDDFGTGHSSLDRLLVLPATELKIDQSLIRDMEASAALLRAAVRTAHDYGLRVVAEGVETEEHFEWCIELGCDRAQGYLFSRPTTEHAIAQLLAVA
ncbi:EAL domain-containing protein [Conyzicola sp.]|uniref:EAL domain-containing protein n=1 Tax=Conyzicola sp. TaxID=1969404 RepID=UPI003989F85C